MPKKKKNLAAVIAMSLLTGISSGLVTNVIWQNQLLSLQFGLSITLSALLIFKIQEWQKHQALLGRLKIFPHFDSAMDSLIQSIRETSSLSIVAIRGAHIFDSDVFVNAKKMALRNKLKIKIALLHPDSEEMLNYLHHTVPQANAGEYIQKYMSLASNILSNKNHGIDIEAKLYKESPLWKLIITDGHCYFIGYTEDRRGNSLPLIRVDNNQNSFSVALNRYFMEVWNGSEIIAEPTHSPDGVKLSGAEAAI